MATAPCRSVCVGVTSREMDVLRLLEDGLSNADIGTRLFLSPRTVETHVANLLSKSGASNRMQLVTWARSEAGEPASPGQPERRPR